MSGVVLGPALFSHCSAAAIRKRRTRAETSPETKKAAHGGGLRIPDSESIYQDLRRLELETVGKNAIGRRQRCRPGAATIGSDCEDTRSDTDLDAAHPGIREVGELLPGRSAI